GLLEHGGPGDLAPQSRGVQEGLQRDALLDAPRGAQPRGLHALVADRLVAGQGLEQHLGVVQRDAVDVAPEEVVVGDAVVDDLLAVAGDHVAREVLPARREALGDDPYGLGARVLLDRGHRDSLARAHAPRAGCSWTLRTTFSLFGMDGARGAS